MNLVNYIERGLSAKEIADIEKISIRKVKNIYVLNYSGTTSAKIFGEFIYDNSNIYMKRKYNIFKGFIQYRHIIES